MKKIFGLGLVAMLVMAMVGGGTWAYFSDTETTTGNTLVAGTLDLGLANSANGTQTGGATGTWDVPLSNWAPGDNISGSLFINNDGTIDMSSVNATFSYVFTEGTPLTIDAGPGGSTDNLTNMIVAEVATFNGSTVAAIQGQTLDQLVTAGSISLGQTLVSNTEKALYILWRFSSAATNGAQGDSAELTVTITGMQ